VAYTLPVLPCLVGKPHPTRHPFCGRKNTKKILPFKIATWNVRTLLDRDAGTNRPQRRTALVAAELKRYDIDIAALSETRFSEDGSVTEEGEGYTFFWKGLPKDAPRRIHGVGFAIKNSLLRTLPEAPVGVSERLMTLRIPLARNRYASIISAYAPTLDSDEDIKDAFYESLDAALRRVPRSDKLVLLGDFNARVGKDHLIWSEIIGKHGVGNMNRNGLRLLILCAEHNLVITNTLFQLPEKYKTSWQHPRSKHWHLLDFVIVRKADVADVQITRAMRGADCWTDHRLIRTKLRLAVRPPVRKKAPMKRLNTCSLALREARRCLGADMSQKLQELPGPNPDGTAPEDIDREWTAMQEAVLQVSKDSLGFVRRRQPDWFDESNAEIGELLQAKRKAHDATLSNPTSVALRRRWQDLRAEAQRRLRALQNEWYTKKSHEIQAYADLNDSHGFYEAVKTLYGPSSRSQAPVRSADGANLIKDRQQILERWGEHFSILLNKKNPTNPEILESIPTLPSIPALDAPPTFHEFSMALVGMKNNKSPGPDGIPAEVLKHGGVDLHRRLHLFIVEVWNSERVPSAWKNANIVAIYKRKGDKSLCGNSRGISLLAVAGKILARIMLSRLLHHVVDQVLPESQCGFRRERSTIDMIFVARQIQEKAREQHRDLFTAFIDLTKAFDTVNRDILWNILEKVGCPPKFVNIIRQLHEDMTAKVVIGGQESDPFNVTVGVKQGCVLAPIMFNIFLVTVTLLARRETAAEDGVQVRFRLDGSLFNLRRLQARSKTSVEHLFDLQYADDCALIAHTPQALQRVLTAVNEAYRALGLVINTDKTQILCQYAGAVPPQPPVFRVGGKELKTIPHFLYLGSILSASCNIEDEVQNRLKAASSAYGRLRQRVFDNRDLTLKTKICVYKAVCLSTLLYGAETWTPYRRHIKTLEAFNIRCLQRILRVSWKDKIPHTRILERTGSISMEATIMRQQLRWIGHTIRMPGNRLPRKVLYGQLEEGPRARGGQKKRLKDHVNASLKLCAINPLGLEAAAADRTDWRSTCQQGLQHFEAERTRQRDEKRRQMHLRATAPTPPGQRQFPCQSCGKICKSRIGLLSHRRTHPENIHQDGRRGVIVVRDGLP
jgi:exonuclease III